MKQCPYCAESIQDAAVVCRYCKRELSGDKPGSPPAVPVPLGQEVAKQLGLTAKIPKWQLGCLAFIFIGGGLAWVSSLLKDSGTGKVTQPAPARAATVVDLTTLLEDYKGNEVGADAKYKGQWVQTTGLIDDIKNDILNRPYVTVGHGREFEIPEVQCFLASSHTGRAAALKKFQSITVTGRVKGLMMNVLMDDCTF